MAGEREEKVGIVTGGGQGIGRGVVRRLLADGWRVVIAEKDAEAGQEAAQAYTGLGTLHFLHTDVSDEGSVQAAVRQAIDLFGRLDGLVNNAGIADPANPPLETLSLDAWNRVLATNLTGYFLCAKHAVPHLRTARGSIVNIASTRAVQSEPHTEAYSASKGGVVALTHALAVSLGPDVRVNCISPGWIVVDDWQKARERTEPALRPIDHAQHPAGRAGRPADVAAMVAFLLSDQAGFITGQHFILDGGMTRKMIYAE